jgi:hypothetical protein
MRSQRAILSRSVNALVADSNQMQCKHLGNALRRRPEFRTTSGDMEIDAMLDNLLSSQVQVAITNVHHPRDSTK